MLGSAPPGDLLGRAVALVLGSPLSPGSLLCWDLRLSPPQGPTQDAAPPCPAAGCQPPGTPSARGIQHWPGGVPGTPGRWWQLTLGSNPGRIPGIRRGMRLPGAMRLVRFRGTGGGEPRLGLEEAPGGDLVDLSAAEPALPRSMRAFLERGRGGLAAARRVLESGGHRVPRGSVRLLAPVGDPEKVICVGLNYRDHCLEQGVGVPREPIIFSKFPSAIAGPFDDIVHPQESTEVDWEVELAAVIGTKGRHIEEASALDHVVGYTVANDISARDWQMRRNGRQWLLGKTFDTFCPLGPALVTKEAVADVHNLSIRCSVNGQVMQDSSTSQLIFRLPKLIAWVSQFVTLVPGDILLTGTPPGVGVFRNPPVFLKRGDEVRCEIEELGTICNRVV